MLCVDSTDKLFYTSIIAAFDGLDGILDIDIEGEIVPSADQEELLEAVLLGRGEGGHLVGQDERGRRRRSDIDRIGTGVGLDLGLLGSRYQRRTRTNGRR